MTQGFADTSIDLDNPRPVVSGRSSKTGDLELLRAQSPMFDAVIEEIRGRQIRIGDHWLADFASCNYLGFDLEPQIIDSVDPQVRRWGTHPSWSRMLGSPRLYVDIEDRLTELLGAPDTLVLPTITHIHLTALPVIAAGGWIFVDSQAHRTIWDGCKAAAGAGATLRRYPTNDLAELERLLRAAPASVTKVICTDGVNSMTGNTCDLPAMAALARKYDALLYVDDAHGFGVIGEHTPDELCSYGSRGNSVVKHLGESYDNIVLVGGFSKAYSSLLAFMALPTKLKNHLKVAASPYLYSGPSPTASLATVLAGFDVNDDRGDLIRADLHRKTAAVLDVLTELNMFSRNISGLPIIEIPLGRAEDLPAVGNFLFERGVYVTLAAYPLVPRAEVGFRVQLTAANTMDEIALLGATLRELAARFPMPSLESFA
jgi:8-amino-7-oxononanoate synthase